jgi:predicted nuclease of predicted toxin-antitoxin system
VRFLIDECLTVDLVAVAAESGHEAQHVAHVGRAGWRDWNVVPYPSEGDFVLVTNNASDFRQLYAARPLHAGLIILIPVVNRVLQQRLFKAALGELAVIGEPVNHVLEVDLDGEEVTLTLYDLPPRWRPRHVSIAWPKFHIKRGLAPRSALPAAQLPLERHEARVAGPPLQQRRVRNDILVPAGMAARAHQVEHAQIFETEGVAWRHGRACSFLPLYCMEQTMNTSTTKR